MQDHHSYKINRSPSSLAEELTRTLYSSRTYWNYPEDYAAASKPLLRITKDFVESQPVFDLTVGAVLTGFYSFHQTDEGIELNNFWLIPESIGKGYGRILWQHAMEFAKSSGWEEFFILPDPGAAGFYLRMGAVATGEIVKSRLPNGPLFQKMTVRPGS